MENHDDARWVDSRLAALNAGEGWEPHKDASLRRLHYVRRHRRNRTRVLAMAAAAGCLGAAAFPMTRVFAQRCLEACVEEGSRLGQYLWPGAELAAAPDFTLADAAGAPVRLSDFRGKVVLLNFWATWCPPCREEVPWFEEFQRTYGGAGLAVLGISMDDGWGPVRPFLEKNNVTYRVMVGNGEVAKLYGDMRSLPATLLIDRDGRVVKTFAGMGAKGAFEAEIRRLLGR